jgi:hypothetical protein
MKDLLTVLTLKVGPFALILLVGVVAWLFKTHG